MFSFSLILFAILLADVAWWRWADRRLQRTRHPMLWRPLLGLWTGLMLGYLLFFLILPSQGRHAHAWMPIWALAAIYLWHLLVLPGVTVVLAGAGIARAIRGAFRWLRRPKVGGAMSTTDLAKLLAANEEAAPALTRRQLLAAGAVALPPLLTAGAVVRGISQVGHFRVREMEIPLASLPRDLDGLTIAHVSDVHVGRFTRPHMLPAIADATNNLRADLVMMTGDLIDLTLSDLPAGLDFVRRLDPRHGLFLCEGNHDLIENPSAFEQQVVNAGVPLLLDESRTLQLRGHVVQVMGMTWASGGRDANIVGAMSRLLPQRRPDAFQILLAHHPHAFDPATAVGVPLTLSGHTHGGQLMLSPTVGAGPLMYRYWSGLYRRNDSALVVSNGVGNWFPLRINAPAEIVKLTLRSAANA